MNGHGRAETLAFSLAEISRRVAQPIGDADDAPLFVFASGWGSGECHFQRRLARTWGSDSMLHSLLITALGWQLVQSASRAQAARAEPAERALNAEALRQVARTQAVFLRATCEVGAHHQGAWGTVWAALSGDHALYLKLVFPRAKFIFLHRDPTDTFAAGLASMVGAGPAASRSLQWAESFADHWCRLIASFELWHKEVGGMMLGYDQAMSAAPGDVETYLVPHPLLIFG